MYNLFGMTRFGPAKTPAKAVICSRHEPKDKRVPGPGEYDPHKVPDK